MPPKNHKKHASQTHSKAQDDGLHGSQPIVTYTQILQITEIHCHAETANASEPSKQMCGIVPVNEKNMDSFRYVKCILYVVLSLLSIKGSCQAAAGPVVADEYTPPFPPNLARTVARSARTHSNLVSRVQGCCPPRIACPFCSTVTPGSTELEQWTGPKTKWLHQDLPAWWNNHSDAAPERLALAN